MKDINRIKTLLAKKNPSTGQTSASKKSFNKQGEEIKYKALNRPADFHIPKLARPLYDFQLDGVYFIDRQGGNAILGDDMGLGKSSQACGYLQLHNKDRIALIVCPASLKLNWAKECFMWMNKEEGNRVYLISGKTKKLIQEVYLSGSGHLMFEVVKKFPTTGIVIINYDLLKDWFKELTAIKPKVIVLDEAQYVKSPKASRSTATIKLCKTIPKKIVLTGTLIENRPLDAFNAIAIVEPNLFPSRWKYMERYCDLKHNGYGWDSSGASNLPELFQKLAAIMIRRIKQDVLKELPKCVRTAIPLEIDNKAEYKAILSDNSLIEIQKRELLSQTAAFGKLSQCLNWIEDFLDSGKKLVVFANHRKIVDTVWEEFKSCSVKVYGGMSNIDRNKAVENFQNNPKIKLFVGNIVAAGTGLTLTAAAATATIEILSHSPGKHLQCEDRINRIGQEAQGTFAYYFVGINTIDEDSLIELEKRSKTIDQVLDGVDEDSAFSDLTIK